MNVKHDENASCFIVENEAGDAVLEYRTRENGDQKVVDFYRTFVPASLRGQGIAEKLVRAGIAWAKGEGYSMTASCWYAAKFLA